jgi:hypothetical protein
MENLTCETCNQTFDHEDLGQVHPETGEFECDDCIDRYYRMHEYVRQNTRPARIEPDTITPPTTTIKANKMTYYLDNCIESTTLGFDVVRDLNKGGDKRIRIGTYASKRMAELITELYPDSYIVVR